MTEELRRVRVSLPVYEGYRIYRGRLVPASGVKKKDFVLHSDRDMPRRLGEVADERSLIEFAEQYGELGYEGGNPSGDPVTWALKHAKQIHVLLRLVALLPKPDKDEGRDAGSIRAIVQENRERLDIRLDLGELVGVTGVGLCGDSYWGEALKTPIDEGWERDLEQVEAIAHAVVSGIINMNIEAVRPMLEVRQDKDGVSNFFPELYVGTVIEDAYALLYESAMKGAGYRLCKQCDKPFTVTEPHQRFCPNDLGGRSLCGDIYHVSRFRNRAPAGKGRKEGER